MTWSKLKQQLEGFICPALSGRVEYRATSYRYAQDKAGRCYITVDKKEVFNMGDINKLVCWYKTERDIRDDPNVTINVTEDDIEAVRKDGCGVIPEERLPIIAKNRKATEVAERILAAQGVLSKSDFYAAANKFLSSSIEDSLASEDILLNIFAIIDRRVGKGRLKKLEAQMGEKHSVVQYFYKLRMEAG